MPWGKVIPPKPDSDWEKLSYEYGIDLGEEDQKRLKHIQDMMQAQENLRNESLQNMYSNANNNIYPGAITTTTGGTGGGGSGLGLAYTIRGSHTTDVRYKIITTKFWQSPSQCIGHVAVDRGNGLWSLYMGSIMGVPSIANPEHDAQYIVNNGVQIKEWEIASAIFPDLDSQMFII